jgi:hypothetical protein
VDRRLFALAVAWWQEQHEPLDSPRRHVVKSVAAQLKVWRVPLEFRRCPE